MKWISPLRLVGIAAPLGIWALHLVVVYALTGLSCERGLPTQAWLGLRPFVWGLWLATGAAFAAIAWLALRARRAGTRATDADGAWPGFASRLTFLSAVLAAIAVAFTAAPVLMLPHCG